MFFLFSLTMEAAFFLLLFFCVFLSLFILIGCHSARPAVGQRENSEFLSSRRWKMRCLPGRDQQMRLRKFLSGLLVIFFPSLSDSSLTSSSSPICRGDKATDRKPQSLSNMLAFKCLSQLLGAKGFSVSLSASHEPLQRRIISETSQSGVM